MGKHLNSPDERFEGIKKDTTRQSDSGAGKNRPKPEDSKSKGEIHEHVHDESVDEIAEEEE